MSSLDHIHWRLHMFTTWKLPTIATWLQEQGFNFANFLRTSHSRAWKDLKTRWRRGLLWILYPSILIGLIFCLRSTILAAFQLDLDGVACLPDGGYSVQPVDWNFLKASGFFQVTLGFGSLSFAAAKIIDVAWDIIIGRGGQAILVLLSWNVFAEYVTATMKITPITFKTFRTLFVQKDISSLLSIASLIRNFTRRSHKLPSKTAVVFMIATMTFIFAFPTLGSAMTGYSANVEAFVVDRSGNYAPLDNYKRLYYTIEDGDRISRSKGFQLTTDESIFASGIYCYFYNRTRDYYNSNDCALLADVTTYVLKYGLEGATDDSTTFGGGNGTSLGSPSLNIKVQHLPPSYLTSIKNYYEGPRYDKDPLLVRTPSGEKLNLADKESTAWTNGGNSSYNDSYMQSHGKCQPADKLTYQWGFSYIQLILIICLLICWDIGLYSLYISAHIVMLKSGGHDSQAPGDYQADIQLVRAIETQLDEALEETGEKEIAQLNAKELKRCIDKDLNGGSISNKDSLLHTLEARTDIPTWRFRKWMRREILSLFILLISVVGHFLAIWGYPTFILAHFAPILVIFTMYVGQSWRSRAVLLVWSVLVVLTLTIPVWKGQGQ